MSPEALDPVIHAPVRLQVMATLAALAEGDALTFTRLRDMLDLTPGNLTTHLRKLDEAGYTLSSTSGTGRTARTTITLTPAGRQALTAYTTTLRTLLSGIEPG